MISDINTHDYYYQFIRNCKTDLSKYTDKLNSIVEERNLLKIDIDKNKNLYKYKYKLDTSIFDNKIPDNNATFQNKVRNAVENCKDYNHKHILLKLLRFCNCLLRESYYKNLIETTNKKLNLSFTQYNKIIANYYNEVHKSVLKGYGYRFSYGIGTLIIQRREVLKRSKLKIDFKATNERKKQLLEQYGKLYNKEEKEWYDKRQLEYQLPDYRVYKNDTNYYHIALIKSSICNRRHINFKHNEYVHSSLKKLGYEYIADNLIHSEEDVFDLKADLRFKLIIYLRKYPIKYLNYVR